MGVAGKDRFIKTNIKVLIDRSNAFPPLMFNYEGSEFTVLGLSNKEDLMPVNIETAELQRVVTYGYIKQFICSADNGDLYDACLYRNETGNTYIYGIRTRKLPDKPKKEKEEK